MSTHPPIGEIGSYEMFDYPDGCQRPRWIKQPPTRTEFEAAAYRWLREHKHYALLIGAEGFGFTYRQVEHWRNEINEERVDDSVAAAMSWPTVPPS